MINCHPILKKKAAWVSKSHHAGRVSALRYISKLFCVYTAGRQNFHHHFQTVIDESQQSKITNLFAFGQLGQEHGLGQSQFKSMCK